MIEYRVRLGSTGMWHVDYHHGTYAERRERHSRLVREAEADAEARRQEAAA